MPQEVLRGTSRSVAQMNKENYDQWCRMHGPWPLGLNLYQGETISVITWPWAEFLTLCPLHPVSLLPVAILDGYLF